MQAGMRKTDQSRPSDPGRALQLYKRMDEPAGRYINYDGWELPGEAYAHGAGGEATLRSVSGTAA